MANSGLLILRSCKFRSCFKRIEKYTYISKRKQHYDVVITGGGLVGTAMACALARNSKLSEKKVILFEPSSKPVKQSETDPYSNRVVSLNPGSKEFLKSIGAWNRITGFRYAVVKKLQVWDACSDALITFNDDLVNDVSYIVENNVILCALSEVCEDGKNVQVKYNHKISKMTLPKNNDPVSMEMENGEKYTCDLLIGADGFNSLTRKTLGCQYLTWNYKQKGIVATVRLSEPTDNIVAWQRFLPTGPIAILPLTSDLSSLIWSVTTEKADALLTLSEESFVDAINEGFWKVYPKSDLITSATDSMNKVLEFFTLTSNAVRQLPPNIKGILPNSREAFPFAFGHSTKYIGPRVALIGDAAHRIHPLTGQGVNLGFGDVECLSRVLADSVYLGAQFGSITTLAEYESERQKVSVPMLMMADFLQKLYSTSATPVVLVRSLGLQFTHALSPLKQFFINQASH